MNTILKKRQHKTGDNLGVCDLNILPEVSTLSNLVAISLMKSHESGDTISSVFRVTNVRSCNFKRVGASHRKSPLT